MLVSVKSKIISVYFQISYLSQAHLEIQFLNRPNNDRSLYMSEWALSVKAYPVEECKLSSVQSLTMSSVKENQIFIEPSAFK